MAVKMTEIKSRRTSDDHDLPGVAARFEITGTVADVRPYGSGHIHDTFLIETKEKDRPKYILQRINHAIFMDVPALMENIVRVTEHIRAKLSAMPGADIQREVLTVVPARDGRAYNQDDAGRYWRCYVFIDNHRSYDRVSSPELACEGGRVFGRFLWMLQDLPGPPLHETIADFHDPEIHLRKFMELVANDPGQRANAVAAEIAFVRVRADAMKRIQRLAQAGKIPRRVTHNDTKFNNILFDEQGRGLCIIDLDTVMPGYVHYDFGDAVRSGCNPAGEDALDLETVYIDLDLFKAFAEGFLLPLRARLNESEMTHLAFAAKLFAFQVGLRFLNDHLAGDHYFKIRYPGHNLQRARVQFRLLESMEKRFARMEDIIGALAGSGPEKC